MSILTFVEEYVGTLGSFASIGAEWNVGHVGNVLFGWKEEALSLLQTDESKGCPIKI